MGIAIPNFWDKHIFLQQEEHLQKTGYIAITEMVLRGGGGQ